MLPIRTKIALASLIFLLAGCGGSNADSPAATSGGHSNTADESSGSDAPTSGGAGPSGGASGDTPSAEDPTPSPSTPDSGADGPSTGADPDPPETPETPIDGEAGSPEIPSSWTLRELPDVDQFIATHYQDVNDSGEVVATYTRSVVSGGRVSSGVYIWRPDGSSVDLGTLDWETANAAAMNDLGQIAGIHRTIYAADPHDPRPPRAFMYSGGATIDVPMLEVSGVAPSEIASFAADINSSGELTGYHGYNEAGSDRIHRGFVFAGGIRRDLPFEEGVSTRPSAINDNGVVVGLADYPDGSMRAFRFENGATTSLGTLEGFSSSSAADINNAGQIVGTLYNLQYAARVDRQPFQYANGALRTIPLPPTAASGEATAINAHGQVVGTLFPTTGSGAVGSGAFLYSGGETIDLNSLPEVTGAGLKVIGAASINDEGQILVQVESPSTPGVPGYYLLSPGT